MALVALKEEATMSELAGRLGVHPTMINNWERALVERAPNIFSKGQKFRKQTEAQVDELYRQIGKLQVEWDSLSKTLIV